MSEEEKDILISILEGQRNAALSELARFVARAAILERRLAAMGGTPSDAAAA